MNGEMQLEAKRLRQRGYGVVWIRENDKRPRAKGWTLRSQEPEDYTPGSNLGLMTGPLSGNLVCVDLDSSDALRLADQYLPPTPMVDGRPGKPRSHRWYRIVGEVPAEHTAASN